MLKINEIGVRSGEIIESAPGAKQCTGTKMQIRGFYPPSQERVEKLSSECIRDQLNNYKFFNKLSTINERYSWLMGNSIENDDLYMDDVDLWVKFINIGGAFMIKALGENVNLLLKGNPNDSEGYWPIKEVYNLFPKKPGSRAKKHTLIFRPNNWILSYDAQDTQKIYDGLAINIESGEITRTNFNISEIQGVSIIKAPPELAKNAPELAIFHQLGNKLEYHELEKICGEIGLDIEIMGAVRKIISWFSPSPHKSLIQKIIRTRATHVEYNSIEYPSREVLATSFCILATLPGAFVPNIQRYVSGLEAALKRLAVSIAEDGWIENGKIISTLLAGSLLAQNLVSWRPSNNLIKAWLIYGLSVLDNGYMYVYDWHSLMGVDISINEWTDWYMSYFLLENIKSFESDEKMFASIAQNGGKHTEFEDIRGEKRVVPIIHCIDQHSYTNIAHYFPYETLVKLGSYSELFKQIWNRIVGINPRKPDHAGFDFVNGNVFFQQTRRAQMMIWISMSTVPIEKNITSERSVEISYKLDPSWIASFTSPYEYKNFMVLMDPDSIYEYKVMKRPSRDKEPKEVTEEEKMEAIDEFKYRLSEGIEFQDVPKSLEILKGKKLYSMYEDLYVIKSEKGYTELEETLNIKINVPCTEGKSDDYLYTSLIETGNYIRLSHGEDYKSKFREYISSLPIKVLQRMSIYMNYDSEIELYRIGRHGEGTEYSVTIQDTGVNHLLAFIATNYPVCLVKSGSKYRVKNGPILWILYDIIREKLSTVNPEQVWKFPTPELRKLWQHQIEAIENLLETRHKKKGRLISYMPGTGKSAIVVNYISKLIEQGVMNKYCLYSLPPSATTTILRELDMRNIDYIQLDMRSTSKGQKQLVPGRVNVLHHDHLRMLDMEEIKVKAPNMLFIIDEAHRLLNATIRTSIGFEIATLSDDTVLLTGTLIKDTHIEPVINWLKLCTNFEVTTKNYWIALSSIISGNARTKVIVEREEIEARMSSDEARRYYDLVPSGLGGVASKISFRDALNVCYESTDREIINQTMFYLESEVGVFLVARNRSHQEILANELNKRGVNSVFLIDSNHSISLTPVDDPSRVPKVVITTISHSEGYNLTRYRIMISSVYMSNGATRAQLEGRINRLNQTSPIVKIIVIHCGLLSYILKRYNRVRSMGELLKQLAKDINIDSKDIDY